MSDKCIKLVRPSKAMTRIGNLVFNKVGSQKDEVAWMTIKRYIAKLENINNNEKS